MNKSQLVDAVAEQTGQDPKQVAAIINVTLEAVQVAVAKGDTVQIIGFGSFERRFRRAGETRTPQGGTVQLPDRHVPAFKAGAGFKQAVSA